MPRVVHCEQEVRGLGEDQSCYLDYAVNKSNIGSKYVTYTCGVYDVIMLGGWWEYTHLSALYRLQADTVTHRTFCTIHTATSLSCIPSKFISSIIKYTC